MKENKQLFKDIVLRFAEESKCESYAVACIAVKDNRIIASGVNGTLPNNMNCKEYMEIIEYPKSGYNGSYIDWRKTDDWRHHHHKFSEVSELHGEQAVIVDCCIRGISLRNVDIYVTHMPCIQCAKLFAFIKPRIIYYIFDYDKADKSSMELLKEAGVNIERID